MSPEKIIRIPRCYDSHVHWLGTGSKLNIISLDGIKSYNDLVKLATQWKTPNRGNWFLGFGWDQNQWEDQFVPHHKILDQLFPENPVSFVRIDGHSTWVNKKAMQAAGMIDGWLPFFHTSGGRIELDKDGTPSGLFIDEAKDHIDKAIPGLTDSEMRSYLLQGMEVFLRSGFTHIRDVGGSFKQWEIAEALENENKLHLFVEMFFNLDCIDNLSERISELLSAQSQQLKQSPLLKHLRVGGLKLYYDGALGSEGAYLSQNYSGKSDCGLRLLELSKIEEVLHRCWEKNISVAIHTLGDEAVHQVVQVASKLKERGIEGKLNLEHCELVRDETIHLMKSLNIHCHMQPSHFLSDRVWLKKKLGNLYQYVFPWKKLIDASISVSFGSDSPIEPPSIKKTMEALEAAEKEGIMLPPLKDYFTLHSHPDSNWGGDQISIFDHRGMKVENFNN